MTDYGCAECDRQTGRREFVRELAAVVAGVACALGIDPVRAIALPIDTTSGRLSGVDEAAYPIPPADGATIDKPREVILVRYEGAVYAFSLSCPHQKTPLRWNAEDHRFQCPKHKSRFQPDGSFIDGRATRNMDRYAIRREANEVRVSLDKLYRDDENRDAWLSAVVRL
jgi:nitrite reductase/ring-hydroxylating ferredoxin subunit